MTDMQPSDTSQQRSEDSDGTLQRRTFLAASCGAGITMFAGCASENGGSADGASDGTGSADGSDGAGTDSGSFRLLISDMPADIGDFDRLDVSFDRARIFEDGGDAEIESDDGGDETNETEENATAAAQETDEGGSDGEEVDEGDTEDDGDTKEGPEEGDSGEDEETDTDSTADESADESTDGEGQAGFYNLDLDGATVDLTQVVDDRAISVFDGELSEGRYTKIELYVADIEGIVGGEVAEVKVPSGKLQITQPFEVVAGESVDFVFDINVVKRGRELRYNLTPVISKSGVRGEDVDVEEVDGGAENDEAENDGAESDEPESDEEERSEEQNGDGTEMGEDGGGGQTNESGEQ